MGQANVLVSARVAAPIDVVFERISDHEAMRDWPGVKKSVLIAEGDPRNGVGAVRAITASGLTIHERVVHYDPPHRYDYKIIKGLPVDHLGSVCLTERGDAVDVQWQVTMHSRIPFLAQVVGMLIRRGLPAALSYVKREAERAAA